MSARQDRSGLIWGAILIAVGVLFFIGQLVDFFNWGDFWPFIVITIGVVFFVAMFLGGKSAAGLAIPGSVVTGVGLILLVQNIFGLWETWAYAWGLVISAVGVGVAIYGYWSGKPESVKGGWETARVGLILFLVFGVIMEFIFSFTGVSGRQNQLLFAILLVALGVVQFVWRAFRLIANPEGVSEAGRDLMGPVILTGIGILAVLMVLDYLPAWDLFRLLSLWPLLLIAAGFQLMVGKRYPWVGALVGILLVAVVLGIALAGERVGIRLGMPFPFVISSGDAWEVRERIEGNGVMGEKSYAVRNFDRVLLALPGKMEIVQGDREALTIRAEENLLEYIQVNVRNSQLVIDGEAGIGLQPNQEIVYRLEVRELKEIVTSSASEVVIPVLRTEVLEINSSGVGTFKLGDLQAEQFEVQISGSGTAEATGEVNRLEVQISGAGNFDGADLQVQEAEIQVSGLGNATLWVEDKLDARISGAGSIAYYGDPRVDEEISGAGVVRRLGDK